MPEAISAIFPICTHGSDFFVRVLTGVDKTQKHADGSVENRTQEAWSGTYLECLTQAYLVFVSSSEPPICLLTSRLLECRLV